MDPHQQWDMIGCAPAFDEGLAPIRAKLGERRPQRLAECWRLGRAPVFDDQHDL